MHTHSHAGKPLSSCTCSLIGFIVQAPNEAAPVQSREDLSCLFLHTPHLVNPCFSQRSENVTPSAQVRVWDLSAGNELQSHPRQVQKSFLSSHRQPALHIPKVACSRNKGNSKKEKGSQQLSAPINVAFRPLGGPQWFHKVEGALQIKNNSLPVKGNVF